MAPDEMPYLIASWSGKPGKIGRLRQRIRWVIKRAEAHGYRMRQRAYDRSGLGLHLSMIATARVKPAEARSILAGKHDT
jgi:hypothetical protein